ncbi:aldo/keto reductase [Mangrovicella endophytica]|uniref:aldo/keto reductase n=1 Tax=Mangrovicella endophytica TaxID=2066697 RepID=UPI000C9DC465|nr:aldo/keto reductase [Mangrovicella endophytica]
MQPRPLGRTGLQIMPLVFGGNVFGWTVDEAQSFRLLDGFVDAGFNAIDTADVYSSWVPGHSGGESETIIGKWLKANPAKRDKVLILTKVGSDLGGDRKGLSARWIAQAVEDSLKRLQVEQIDLYQSHWPDESVPYEETLGAYATLLKVGKIRAIGASNLSASQLRESLKVAREKGLPRYETLQPEYNLYSRADFEGELRELVVAEGIGVITYFSLAAGFLTGKYRSDADLSKSQRGEGMGKYLNERGFRILKALDAVADRHGAKPAEVALAFVMAAEGVTAPIASATSDSQLQSLVKSASLTLSAGDKAELERASAV